MPLFIGIVSLVSELLLSATFKGWQTDCIVSACEKDYFNLLLRKRSNHDI
jgi:hypothetical protein